MAFLTTKASNLHQQSLVEPIGNFISDIDLLHSRAHFLECDRYGGMNSYESVKKSLIPPEFAPIRVDVALRSAVSDHLCATKSKISPKLDTRICPIFSRKAAFSCWTYLSGWHCPPSRSPIALAQTCKVPNLPRQREHKNASRLNPPSVWSSRRPKRKRLLSRCPI
jgi:hypothetical protein